MGLGASHRSRYQSSTTSTRRWRRRGPIGRIVSLTLRNPVLFLLPIMGAIIFGALVLTTDRTPATPVTAPVAADGCAMFCTDTEYTPADTKYSKTASVARPAHATAPAPVAPAAANGCAMFCTDIENSKTTAAPVGLIDFSAGSSHGAGHTAGWQMRL
ncbi:hypothetical protein AB0C34_17030 [Nocardia sp. NPDC049220]|uniref:hypothetical protein n=1 Tax=Nocardia sp. NPDC049220 TaxID=3155273 RepID=UPI0033CEE4E9